MLRDDKNLKDSSPEAGIVIKDRLPAFSYSKLDKLIMALYMVTDIMDKEEPLRNKLRNLGAEIISDANSSPSKAGLKIVEINSFLDIASAVGMISGMNSSILKKEFNELKNSINRSNVGGNEEWLGEFLKQPSQIFSVHKTENYKESEKSYQGHKTNIGIQKGSTLMKALSGVSVSDRNIPTTSVIKDNFDVLKKQRREEIIKIIKVKKEATITDIRAGSKEILDSNSALVSCSEKTLQRELISMIKDNVLNKSGEKRWSKYFLPN